MKKYVLFSVTCLFASVVFGQNPSAVIFDGEDGTNPWWGVGGATVEVVNWLQKNGVNTSTYGATIWRNNDNDPWNGGGITLDLNISAYNKISIDVSKRVSGEVQVELQDGDARAYLKLPYTPINAGEWQTLLFDLPDGWTPLTALLVAPHNVNTGENPINFDEDNERHRMSWDNVKVYYDNETTTIIPKAVANSFHIFTQNDNIRMAVNEPSQISIYSVSGALIFFQYVENEIIISQNKGIYIVKVGRDVQKMVVK
jgi:hypothetical protein